MQAKVKYFR